MGQNPTSGLLSVARRKEIYAVCSKYDIIIIEDDPYWYLQYPSANAMSMKHRGQAVSRNFPTAEHNYNDPAEGKKSSGFKFLDSLVPSYLSMDTDGRVIRLDTFSKTIAPGCRLGWITSQPAIIEKLFLITENTTSQPSGFVQSMVAELLVGPHSPEDGGIGGAKDGLGWNAAGWVRWLEGLRGNYERRMNTMASLLEENKFYVSASSQRASVNDSDSLSEGENYEVVSKTQMYDFAWPMAGMFLWLEIKLESHPLFSRVDTTRLSRALWVHLTQEPYLVIVAFGTLFAPLPEIAEEKAWRYLRLCFAAVDEDKLETYTRGFIACFNHFWSLKKTKDIDYILRGDDEDNKDNSLDTLLQVTKAIDANEDSSIERQAGKFMTYFC